MTKKISALPTISPYGEQAASYIELARDGASHKNVTRVRLDTATIFNIDPAGDDSVGDGSPGAPFKTSQACLDFLVRYIDFGGNLVTMQHAAGTYTGKLIPVYGPGLQSLNWFTGNTAIVRFLEPWTGGGILHVLGDHDDPTQCKFNCGSNFGVLSDHYPGGRVIIDGIEFHQPGLGAIYNSAQNCYFSTGDLSFVGTGGGYCIGIADGGYCLTWFSTMNVEGNHSGFLYNANGGRHHFEGTEINFNGSPIPDFGDAFAVIGIQGTINFGFGNTFVGDFTGQRYNIYDGGVMTFYGFADDDPSGGSDETNFPASSDPGIKLFGGMFNGQAEPNEWNYFKPADEPFANGGGGATEDTDLWFMAYANRSYAFKFRIFYDTPTAADFSFTVKGPSAPTLVRIMHRAMGPGATALGSEKVETAFNFTEVAVPETSGTTGGYIEIEGILHNGANTAHVGFNWDQDTGNASPTTVRAGSSVEYRRVA